MSAAKVKGRTNSCAPAAASSYKGSQTTEKITIAAVPFVSEEQVRSAFGKVDPNHYGVLPVLVVLENGTGKALRLSLQADYIGPDGKHVDATPASDATFIGGTDVLEVDCPATHDATLADPGITFVAQRVS